MLLKIKIVGYIFESMEWGSTMQIWLRRIVAAESEAAVFKSQTTRVDRTTFFMIAETEVQGPQTEFESQFCVNKYFVKTRRP